MASKRLIEIFSAGCAVCQDTINLVNSLICPSCEVMVLDMHQPAIANRAKELGIKSVPAVVVNGKLASCCEGRGPDAGALKAAGIGEPL